MKTYEKPIAIKTDDLSEGIYAASGGVNHASVTINNSTQYDASQNAYWNTLDWSDWKASELDRHANGGMYVTLNYNMPVKYKNTGTPFISLHSGDGTNVLVLDVKLGTQYKVQGATVTVTPVTEGAAPTLQSASAQCYGC